MAVSTPVEALPLTAFAPLQPPEAAQELALVELQVSVAEVPVPIIVGLAVSVTAGAGGVWLTVTIAVAALVPPAPVQLSEKFVVAVSAPVEVLPLTAFTPLQPPEATQEVALVELQVSVAAVPVPIIVGLAVSVTAGAGGVWLTVTVAAAALVPPAPVQLSEKFVVAVSAPVEVLPLVDFTPLQPPEAAQEVAFVELHERVAVLPLVRLAGFARSDTVGAGAVPAVTVTDVVALPLPPAPVQDRLKLVVAANAPVALLPLVATVPLQPPEAVHDVALVELQLRVAALPEAMLVGDALSATVGAATAALLEPPPQEASTRHAPTATAVTTNRLTDTVQCEVFICGQFSDVGAHKYAGKEFVFAKCLSAVIQRLSN